MLISVLLHEIGHALAYTLATGDRNWYIQVGQGKTILDTKVLTINLIAVDGFFSPEKDKAESKAQLVMTLLGGPIVSLLLIAGLTIVLSGGISLPPEVTASGTVRAVLYIALFINSLILLWSVIPAYGFFRDMKDLGTDVMQIIDILKSDRE